jgi:hypothetical protein
MKTGMSKKNAGKKSEGSVQRNVFIINHIKE